MRPALPTYLYATGPAEESGAVDSEEKVEGGDDVEGMRIHLNLSSQNLVRQNVLNRTNHISQCQIDPSAIMSYQCVT